MGIVKLTVEGTKKDIALLSTMFLRTSKITAFKVLEESKDCRNRIRRDIEVNFENSALEVND